MVSKERKLGGGVGGSSQWGLMLERKAPRGQLKSGTVLPAAVIPAALGMVVALERAGRLSAEKHALGTIPHREVRQFSLPDMLALLYRCMLHF